MRIVLDTNVLISALLNPNGHPASIINLILSDELILLFDNRIMDEYRQVLSREKFNFDAALYEPLLDYISDNGIFVVAQPFKSPHVDKDDAAFYEVALSAQADWLITGNTKHFPKEKLIITPACFIDKFLSLQ
jgi:putative PIN family toxin of toxin-antitoxin system